MWKEYDSNGIGMMMRWRSLASSISLIFVGLVVGILVAESILRVSNVWIGRHSDTMFSVLQYDRLLGWRMKPGITQLIDLVDVEGVVVRSNTQGFWDEEFQIQRNGKARAAFIGDSFTWGMGVREGERFSNLIAGRNPDVECLNFGIPGYGTDQELLLYRHHVRTYQPDLIVLTVYQNDYRDNMYSVRYGRPKPYFELSEEDQLRLQNIPVTTETFWDHGILNEVPSTYASLFKSPVERRSRTAHWFSKNSDLVRLVYSVLSGRVQVEKAAAPTRPVTNSAADASKPVGCEEQVRLLGRLLQQLGRETNAEGSKLLVMLAGEAVPQHELLARRLTEEGIWYLNLTTPALWGRMSADEPIYFRWNGHWTPEAHRAVARVLSPALRAAGVLSRSVGAS